MDGIMVCTEHALCMFRSCSSVHWNCFSQVVYVYVQSVLLHVFFLTHFPYQQTFVFYTELPITPLNFPRDTS